MENILEISESLKSISGVEMGKPNSGASSLLKRILFLCVLLISMTPGATSAQTWTGILDPSRAVDWRNVPFNIPSSSWTQCATSACTALTSAGTGATAAQINAAIASAPANSYVKLGSGTFTLSNCLNWNGHSNVVLRGNGPMSTIVKFTAGCAGASGTADVLLQAATNIYDQSTNALPGGSNALTLTGTAGSAVGGPTGVGLFPQGATQLIVSGVGSDTPKVGTLLMIDQADEMAPAAGWLQCSQNTTASSCSANGNNNGRKISGILHEQVQVVKITNISGSTYTISPGLYANNLRLSQTPGAWWNYSSSLCTRCGIENLTLDHTVSGVQSGSVSSINIYDCYQCWISNIRNIYGGGRNHIYIFQSSQGVIRDSYFYGSVGNSSGGGYGFDPVESSDFLIENNIFDQVPAPMVFEVASGFVVGYNFSWNNQFVNPNFMAPTYPSHDPGSHMNLFEGNYFNGVSQDTQHGASPVITYFRNDFPGQQPVPFDKSQGTGNTGLGTTSFELQSLAHGINIIGNTLGMITCVGGTYAGRPADLNSQCVGGSATGPSFHLGYETSPAVGSANCYKTIYTLGWADNCTGPDGTLNTDTGVASTILRWGNYDTVTGAVQWSNAEIPTAGALYINGNSVPASHALPSSFYYNSKPSWYASAYGNPPFPPIGPDVTGGDLAGLGGHAYRIPARLCYENTANDSANYPGTSVIKFDASTCYGTSTGTTPIAPSSGLTAIVNTTN